MIWLIFSVVVCMESNLVENDGIMDSKGTAQNIDDGHHTLPLTDTVNQNSMNSCCHRTQTGYWFGDVVSTQKKPETNPSLRTWFFDFSTFQFALAQHADCHCTILFGKRRQCENCWESIGQMKLSNSSFESNALSIFKHRKQTNRKKNINKSKV